jgi:hypothetical protein
MGLQMQQLEIKHSDTLTELLKGREFFDSNKFMDICRYALHPCLQVRNAGFKVKGTNEAEFLIQAFGVNYGLCRDESYIAWFYDVDFELCCDDLGINVEYAREMLEKMNKHVFIYQFKKKERENDAH